MNRQFFLNAAPAILKIVEKDNEVYEETFGYNFIVFTKDKSADDIIEAFAERLKNDPHDELLIAAAEQNKITQSRLQLLFS